MALSPQWSPELLKRKQKTTKTIDLVPKTGLQYDRQRRVLDAVSFKRRHPKASMSYAARRAGTTLKTVLKYAPSAVEVRSGRYDATPTDRISRTMEFLTKRRGPRDAGEFAGCDAAIDLPTCHPARRGDLRRGP